MFCVCTACACCMLNGCHSVGSAYAFFRRLSLVCQKFWIEQQSYEAHPSDTSFALVLMNRSIHTSSVFLALFILCEKFKSVYLQFCSLRLFFLALVCQKIWMRNKEFTRSTLMIVWSLSFWQTDGFTPAHFCWHFLFFVKSSRVCWFSILLTALGSTTCLTKFSFWKLWFCFSPILCLCFFFLHHCKASLSCVWHFLFTASSSVCVPVQTYLPNSCKKVTMHQELLILFWKMCDLNKVCRCFGQKKEK